MQVKRVQIPKATEKSVLVMWKDHLDKLGGWLITGTIAKQCGTLQTTQNTECHKKCANILIIMITSRYTPCELVSVVSELKCILYGYSNT